MLCWDLLKPVLQLLGGGHGTECCYDGLKVLGPLLSSSPRPLQLLSHIVVVLQFVLLLLPSVGVIGYLHVLSTLSTTTLSSWFSVTCLSVCMWKSLGLRHSVSLEVCPTLTLEFPVQTWYSSWVVMFMRAEPAALFHLLLCPGVYKGFLGTASILCCFDDVVVSPVSRVFSCCGLM